MKKFMNSVGFAVKGIRYAWLTERNFRVQLFVFVVVLIAAILLHISRVELLSILTISAVLLALELTNTAIERLADKVSPEYNAQIGVVKDLMAGAVLVCSIFAFSIGLIVFIEPLRKLFQS